MFVEALILDVDDGVLCHERDLVQLDAHAVLTGVNLGELLAVRCVDERGLRLIGLLDDRAGIVGLAEHVAHQVGPLGDPQECREDGDHGDDGCQGDHAHDRRHANEPIGRSLLHPARGDVLARASGRGVSCGSTQVGSG